MPYARPALLLAVITTTLLARMDDEARSFLDIVRFENVPAFILYSAALYVVFSLILGIAAGLRRRLSPAVKA